MNIIELLRQSEGKTLEFKRDISSPTNIIRTIIAFANTAGGVLVIGVEDDTHYIVGVDAPHKLEERLSNLISDNIAPHILPDIDIIPWRDAYLIAIRVYPSALRPHYYKKLTMDSGVFIRIGSTNRSADAEMTKELQRIVRNISFDEEPLTQLTAEELDFNAITTQFSHVRKISIKDLETLELIVPHQGKLVPTNAGILLFGKDREKYFPHAWAQAARFKGKDKTHIIDHAEFHDHPMVAIDQLLDFVSKHAMRGIEISSARHTESWNLPFNAVREAVINAFVHADYSLTGTPIRLAIFDDRIEIDNPGILRFGLTIDDIKQGISKLRNRIIGQIFHKVGLIERWGSGVTRIMSSCREGGYREPRFEEIGTHFRVTLFTDQTTPYDLDEINLSIIKILEQYSHIGTTTGKIAEIIKMSTRSVRTRLIKLIDLGLVIVVASNAEDPNRLYFLK